MALVYSGRQIVHTARQQGGPLPMAPAAGLALATAGRTDGPYQGAGGSYATMYRTQPAVRMTVNFQARNLAHLGAHVFVRVNDTDRRRDTSSGLARLLARPNFATTPYRLFEHSLLDYGIYGNAYWFKGVRHARTKEPAELWRLPAGRVEVLGDLYPSAYGFYGFDGHYYQIPPADVVHFRLGNPDSAVVGLSHLETLRKRLLEERYIQDYRLQFWRQGARIAGVIERPMEAPDWTDADRSHFRQQFAEAYGGPGGAGLVPVLDEGMTWKSAHQSAEEAQLEQARKLTGEEVAREYAIPLPMLGYLEHATYSNMREQHKHLYQDTLGPLAEEWQQDIELQVVPEFADPARVYVEFNLQAKLAGSFEEQADALTASVGGPWMSVNEARARMNYPRDPDPEKDKVLSPLNMTTDAAHALERVRRRRDEREEEAA